MRRMLLLVALMGMTTASSQAALLGLTQQLPDISTGFVSVTNNGSGTFQASGFAQSLDTVMGGGPEFTPDGGFAMWDLVMTVNPADGALISGTVSVLGTITGFPAVSGTLLTGTITEYGSQHGDSDQFDFRFNVTGGDLAAIYGALGGIILSAGATDFNGSNWNTAWANDGISGTADTFGQPVIVVPSPAAAGFGLVMIAGMGLIRSRKAR